MTVAIAIGTHGWATKQLLKAAEMLLGEQENVDWTDFVPGENAETLIEKYNAQLAKLDTSEGVPPLVDIWGGSPFNTASRIVVDREHYGVIADVNTLMLVETFTARNDDPSFDELVALTVEVGSESVKTLKAKPMEKAVPAPVPAAAPKAAVLVRPMGPNDYMVVGLARIDDHLIYGQIATRWTKETNVTHIIVVSDEMATGMMRKALLTQIAPPGATAHVVDVAKMIRVYNNPIYAGRRVMLLFASPADVGCIAESSVKITSANIGGVAFRQGKTQVNNAVSVNVKNIEAFNKLSARGIELEARKVSTDPKLKTMDLITKVDKQPSRSRPSFHFKT